MLYDVAIKPNPSPSVLSDYKELLDGTIYGKVKFSFIDRQLGLGDAGFKGVKYSIDELIPPLFNFFDDLNDTIRSSILNDSAFKLSGVASELLDNTILRIKPNWNVVIDICILISSLYELHCSLITLRDTPFNIINLLITATCISGLYYIVNKHYDWNQVIDTTNQYTYTTQHDMYVNKPYYHQYTDKYKYSDSKNQSHASHSNTDTYTHHQSAT